MLVVTAVIATACGGTTSTPNASPDGASSDRLVMPTAAPSETPALRAELIDLVVKNVSPAYKVTYSMSAARALGVAVTSTQTHVWRAPELRIDTTTSASDLSTTVSVFMLTSGEYVCLKLFGAGTCLFSAAGDIPGYEQQMRRPADDFRAQYAHLDVAPLPDRAIAGITGSCFSFRPKQGETGIAGRSCYSSDGIPLLWVTNIGTGETTIEATDVSRRVVDADFRPPYPLITAPPVRAPRPTPTPTPLHQ